MAKDRGSDGRFVKGHKPPVTAGRPRGALNKLSRPVAEQVVEGLADIAAVIKDLVKNQPAAVVPLIKHMMPSGDPAAATGGSIIAVNILPVAEGHMFYKLDDLTLALFNQPDIEQLGQLELELKDGEVRRAFGRCLEKINGQLLCLFGPEEIAWAKKMRGDAPEPGPSQEPAVDPATLENVVRLRPGPTDAA